MTGTPRTDESVYTADIPQIGGATEKVKVVSADFAKMLEKWLIEARDELAVARAEVVRLNQKIKNDDYYITGLKQEIINITEESEFHAKNAERYWGEKLAERDALIVYLLSRMSAPELLRLRNHDNGLFELAAKIDSAAVGIVEARAA